MFYVIIHSNVRLIKFFLHRLKEERFSLPAVSFFVLYSNQKMSFWHQRKRPIFVTRFRETDFDTHSF